MTATDLFYELLKISIGHGRCLSKSPSPDEWFQIYRIAEKHCLLGICFHGVECLYAQNQTPPKKLLFKWIGQVELCKSLNLLANEKCTELQEHLDAAGLVSCVLKGQAVAQYYDQSLKDLRQCGDIDVWIKGGYCTVSKFVQQVCPTTEVAYHRFHFHIFPEIEVELHQHPSLMNNPYHNRILQKWVDSFGKETFIKYDNMGFYAPPSVFDKVFLLCHLYRHFVAEGVGLRQLMDYYFVLKNSNISENLRAAKLIRRLGMKKFAGAVMWIMTYLFELHQEKFIVEPNEKEGRYLLNEIMQAGNFGFHDKRYVHSGRFSMQKQNIRHSAHLFFHYPSEVLWMPLWLIWHFFWKKIKIRQIKKNIVSSNERK